jgi:arginase
MKISLIYAYWPNQPQGTTWCDLPWALRDKGLPKKLHAAGHEVLETVLMAEEPFAEELPAGLKLAGAVAEAVREAEAEGELPVVVAGSCAVAAIGVVAGLGAGTSIAWFDAHADLNTPETSESGLLEGMALAAASGHAWRAIVAREAGLTDPVRLEDTVLFGVRDIDPAEAEIIAGCGLATTSQPAELARLMAERERVYIHLDIDVHDARGLATSQFAVHGGPSPEAVREALVGLTNVKAIALTGLDPAAPDAARAEEIAIEHVLAIAGAQRV